MILVTRFTEANRFYLRVTPKRDNILDKCTVLFDNQPILTKDTHKPQTILRGALNFEFWANNPPANLDERLIVVKNKGKTIFKSKFNELDSDD
jgi:hypothetical protein